MHYVVIGTDTDIGKTFISSHLCQQLLKQNQNLLYCKIIQTGSRTSSDEKYIKKICGNTINTKTLYSFKYPASPHLAAHLEKIEIDKKILFQEITNLIKEFPNIVFESSGGIMVPISKKFYFIDLLEHFKIPTLLVTRPGLGTLNHTLLTVEALNSRKIPLLGIILNDINKNSSEKKIIDDNKAFLEEKIGIPILFSKNDQAFNKYNLKSILID